MVDFAKILIFVGAIFIALGLLVFLFGKIPGLGRLPGDILIKKENFTFYFPLATCVLLSIVVSLLLFFFRKQ